ncbi:hypothetical protein ACWIUH_08785 [Ursidibacter arcticus]
MVERYNIRYLRKYIWLCFLVWLSACSSSLKVQELPKQSAESRLFKLEQIVPKQETSLLVIQFEQQQWRWSQTDPLGAPISRLILDLSGWKNDGFITPNKQAQQLFSAIATGLNPSHSLFAFSHITETSNGKQYEVDGTQLWSIQSQLKPVQIYHIELADGSQWKVEEIEQ